MFRKTLYVFIEEKGPFKLENNLNEIIPRVKDLEKNTRQSNMPRDVSVLSSILACLVFPCARGTLSLRYFTLGIGFECRGTSNSTK